MHRLPLAAQVQCVSGWLADFWLELGVGSAVSREYREWMMQVLY
jgi:hypothetical protein